MTARPENTVPPIDEVIREYGPKTDAEAAAMAAAIKRVRADEDDLQALADLTPFERELADHAYSAGMRQALEAIEAAMGSAAETLSVAALRTALSRQHYLGFQGPALYGGLTMPSNSDRKAALIVSAARRATEARYASAERAGRTVDPGRHRTPGSPTP